MTENKTDFESCKLMIYKLVNERYNMMKYSRPDVQFDDLMSEGMVIYCWCLENYKGKKGMKFTTYLYMNLRERLLDYYNCTMKELNHYEDYNFVDKDGSVSRFEDNIKSPEFDEGTELLSAAKEELSYEGFSILKYIISREWECRGHTSKPSKTQISKKFGFLSEVIDSAMSEITSFWNRTGYLVA